MGQSQSLDEVGHRKESGMSEARAVQEQHEPGPVERLDRQLKYEGTVLKIYQDTVKVKGHQAKWDFIHHDGAAAVVAVTKEGRLLMVRQYRNALDRYTLEIPAGKVDQPGEPKIECAFRELEEETGYRADALEFLISVHTTVAFCDEAIDIFVAKELYPSEQKLDEDEELSVEEWELSDLLDLIYTGKMTDAKTVSAILAYAHKYGGQTD